jgi:hypothetical protein
MKGVQVVHVPDPGPFKRPPFHADINPTNYINPTVLLTDLAPNPTCKVVICGRTSPNIGSKTSPRSWTTSATSAESAAGQDLRELFARGDLELCVGATEVLLDRGARDEEGLGDLGVGLSGQRELTDPTLACGE